MKTFEFEILVVTLANVVKLISQRVVVKISRNLRLVVFVNFFLGLFQFTTHSPDAFVKHEDEEEFLKKLLGRTFFLKTLKHIWIGEMATKESKHKSFGYFSIGIICKYIVEASALKIKEQLIRYVAHARTEWLIIFFGLRASFNLIALENCKNG